MKICSNCKKQLSFDEFSKCKSNKDGLHAWCRICNKAQNREYYLKNRDEVIKKAAHWKKNNIKRARKTMRLWKAANREKVNRGERQRYCILRRKALGKIGLLCCVNCGCEKYELLEINHISGNGYEERKIKQTARFYSDIITGKRNTNDLNILCRPCNSIHYLELLHGKLPYRIEWLGEKLLSGDTKQ